MAATVTLSIRLERTDARIGLQQGIRQLAMEISGRLREQTSRGA